MPISENMVQEIVQEVMAKMQIADAPAGILDTITTAYTQEVNLENISDTIRQRVACRIDII